MAKHLDKCLTVVRKIRFGISVSNRTEPNLPNTEASVRYYSVRFGSVGYRNTEPNLLDVFWPNFWIFKKITLFKAKKILQIFKDCHIKVQKRGKLNI